MSDLRIYIYGFCVAPMGADFELPAGIASQTYLIQTGSLGAIAETHSDIQALKDNDQQLMTAILSHDRVLQDVFDQVPVLPLRFGTQFNQVSAVEAYLHNHQDHYLKRLELLADKAEYLLKLKPKIVDTPPLSDTLTGRDYFLAKKARLQAQSSYQQTQQQQLQALIAHLQQVGHVLLSPTQEGQQRLHLLATRQKTVVEGDLSQWQAIAPTWEMYCSDPLPPYHFAD
ncbi:MAG: GvpL/GvpF family gas vesicle protein [Leptolyngbyaceae cyanobacterium]